MTFFHTHGCVYIYTHTNINFDKLHVTGIFLIVSQHQLMPSSYSILHYHYTLVIFLATSIITGIIQSSLLLIIFLCLHVLFCDANQFFVFLTLIFFHWRWENWSSCWQMPLTRVAAMWLPVAQFSPITAGLWQLLLDKLAWLHISSSAQLPRYDQDWLEEMCCLMTRNLDFNIHGSWNIISFGKAVN